LWSDITGTLNALAVALIDGTLLKWKAAAAKRTLSLFGLEPMHFGGTIFN